MQIDPQTNAERQAARKNRKQEQRYPLLHHAGILEQIVERWTAERHLALHAACWDALETSMTAAQAQAFASTMLYMVCDAEVVCGIAHRTLGCREPRPACGGEMVGYRLHGFPVTLF